MDVKLITYHRSLSYGGCLQAIATENIIDSLGHDVTVIDYQNTYEARQRNGSLIKYGNIKEILVTFIKRNFFKNDYYKDRAFGSAYKEYKKLTKPYTTVSELENLESDVLIVGSDQMWNPKISNGLDPAFFLDFGKAKKKISIATSMGQYILSEEDKKKVKKFLDSFSEISVREEFVKNQIQDLVDKNIKILLDPTLLLDKSWWEKWSSEAIKNVNGEYILAFVIGNHSEKLGDIFKYYSKKFNLPVYRIMLNTFKSSGVNKVIAGPNTREFVDLINNAKFVITDSFHGTAFSINMNRPFAMIPVDGNNVRMEELLNACDLSDRILTDKNYPDIDIDFSSANDYLSKKRIEDIGWIREALSLENED